MDITIDVNEPKPGDRIRIVSWHDSPDTGPTREQIVLRQVRYEDGDIKWDVSVHNPHDDTWVDQTISVRDALR